MGLRSTGISALAAMLLAACGSTVKLDETPVESRTPQPVQPRPAGGSAAAGGTTSAGVAGGSATATNTPQSQVATVDLSKGAAGAAGGSATAAATLGRVVYFDFDSFVIKDEFRSLIEGHARTLAATKAKRMVVEGHTDERGGREYNLALGQKRAEAVVKSLALLGASEGQLEAVSFGKERPVAEGHDEDAWAKNRRAELKDR